MCPTPSATWRTPRSPPSPPHPRSDAPSRCALGLTGTGTSYTERARAVLDRLRFDVQVPAGLVLPAEPRVGWWDASKKDWSDEFITEQDYFLDKRYVITKTYSTSSTS